MFESVIKPLVAHHGYWAVFAIVFLESAGVPLPGETALVLAAIFAGATGSLHIGWIIGLAAVAAMLGDNMGFFVGRRYGLRLINRYGRFVGLTPQRLMLGDYLFGRYGGAIVFFGRFVAFLRVFAALLAGVLGYGWRPFLFFNASGAIIWAALFGGGGYIFGDALTRVTGPLSLAGFLAAAIAFGVALFTAKRHEERFLTQASRAAAAREASREGV